MDHQGIIIFGVTLFVAFIINDWGHRRAKKHQKMMLAKQKNRKKKKR